MLPGSTVLVEYSVPIVSSTAAEGCDPVAPSVNPPSRGAEEPTADGHRWRKRSRPRA